MATTSIFDAKNRFIACTRRSGLRLDAIDAFKAKQGMTHIVAFIADDFDDPLPEDFLLRPLPETR